MRFREIDFRRVRGWRSNRFDVWTGDGRVGDCGDLDCNFCRCLWANIVMMPFLIAVGTENRISALIYQCNGLLVVPSRLFVSLWMMCRREIRGSMGNVYIRKKTFNTMIKHAAEKILAKFKIKVTPNEVFR